MADYQQLKSRIDEGEVIVLDGAIGTELQAMGVPMDPASWRGPGNYTHQATVRQMHERYIKAGADIITTNTFNTLRPALEASGFGELVREINVRSVDAALEAREREPPETGTSTSQAPSHAASPFATAGQGHYWEGPDTAMAQASRRRN